jgi:hypothetical protein
LLNLRKSLQREKNTAGLPDASRALFDAIEVDGKTASRIEVLPKLSARNAKLNARFPSGPPETVQYTAKIVLPSVKIEKVLLLWETAVSAQEESRLSANAAETAPKRPRIIPKSFVLKII